FTCECGDYYIETIKAQGHSFTYYTYNNDATIDSDGTETAKCDNCDETDTRVAIGSKDALILSNSKEAAKQAIEDAIPENASQEVKDKAYEAKTAIDNAETVDEVEAAKQDGIDKINNQIKKEQDEKAATAALNAAQNKAVAELDSKVDGECSSKVISIRDEAIENIINAGSIDEVNAIKEKAVKDIVSQRQADCSYCGHEHGGFFGWLIRFFHSILALFGNKYTG
ncbi:MAG: DUF1542 domain-containing protein, partial [Clostridia bacterium]|nr:DUF1542 domain-containing protein [Clostridia bacterium]